MNSLIKGFSKLAQSFHQLFTNNSKIDVETLMKDCYDKIPYDTKNDVITKKDLNQINPKDPFNVLNNK